jgi:hypothetical protein
MNAETTNAIRGADASVREIIARADSLNAAHKIIAWAFEAQLEWWVYIPFLGWRRRRTRDKLIRIGRYLVDQSDANALDSLTLLSKAKAL